MCLTKKYKFKSWYSFDDDIFEAAKDFYKEEGIFANMVITNKHSYSQINFLTSVSPKRKSISSDDGASEIEVGRFSYLDCSLVVATYSKEGCLADMEFDLVYDSDYDDDDDNDNDNKGTSPIPTKGDKQTIIYT